MQIMPLSPKLLIVCSFDIWGSRPSYSSRRCNSVHAEIIGGQVLMFTSEEGQGPISWVRHYRISRNLARSRCPLRRVNGGRGVAYEVIADVAGRLAG